MEDNTVQYIDSFEIFQEKDAECNIIIQEAEKLKSSVRDYFNDFPLNETPESNVSTINIFDYDLKIDKFTDIESEYNPLSPRLYTSVYNPSYCLYKYNSELNETDKINLTDNLNSEKKNVIKNYVYDTFIGNTISKDYFESFTKQNFLLNLVKKHFSDSDKNIYKLINRNSESKEINIVFLHSKLFDPNIKTDYTIYHLSNAILEIKNDFKYLQQKNFILVGCFTNYQNENSLITELSEIENFKWNKIKDYYPNDFIFLNNCELSDDNINTSDWINNIILPPSLNIEKNKNEISFFYFNKIQDDGIFYKIEVFIPNSIKIEYSLIINLLQKHLVLKNADNKIK